MKKQFIFTGTLTYFLLTGCNTNHIVTPNISSNPKKVMSVKKYTTLNTDKIGTGGNPEVFLIHSCLRKNSKKTLICLNNILDKEKTFYVSTEKNWQPIKLAGRASNIVKRTIKIKNDKEFILYLDTSNVKLPLSSNILYYQKSEDKHTMVIKIDIQKIETNVTLKDREGHTLLDYTIVK